MKMLPIAVMTVALALGGSAALHAQDKPGEMPTEKKPTTKPGRAGRGLVSPWSKMGSLTPEQKTKISEIHMQANADKKKVDDKEEADIMALLTPEQRTEVAKIQDDDAASRRKTKAKPATQPEGM